MQIWWQYILISFAWLYITFAAFIMYVLMLIPTCMIIIHSKRVIAWRRYICSSLFNVFADFSAVILRDWCGTRMHFSSEESWEDLVKDNNVIILANHAGALDWIYASWCYGALTGRNADMRMILQDRLKGVPIFGWAMQILLYLFTSREKDIVANIEHIHKTLKYLLLTGQDRSSMLIFPESGTKATTQDMDKIYPLRPSGFLTCVDAYRQVKNIQDNDNINSIINHISNTIGSNSSIAAIHDLTICFKWRYGPIIPSDVLIHVTRHGLETLPHKYEELEEWLKHCFERKVQLLLQRGGSPDKVPHIDPRQRLRFSYKKDTFSIVMAMLIPSIFVILLLCISTIIRYLTTVGVIFTISSRALGGFDMIELSLHSDMIMNTLQLGAEPSPSPSIDIDNDNIEGGGNDKKNQ